MKKVLAVLSALMFSAGLASAQDGPPIQENTVVNDALTPQFLFTLSSDGGTYSDGVLTLEDVPVVVYFSDRPYRLSGSISIETFAHQWNEQTGVFMSDPPNGTLSILGDGGATNVVVEVSDLGLDEEAGTLTFQTRILDGDMPDTFGVATLFIDGLSFGVDPSTMEEAARLR